MIPQKRILIIEDEVDLAQVLKDYLIANNYETYIVGNGQDCFKLLDTIEFDFIILDINLPDADGIHICQRIRETCTVPIMILSARVSDADKVIALGFGADDYMTKPFSASELVARIKAHLRRVEQLTAVKKEDHILNIGEMRIDERAYTVTLEDKNIELSGKEFELLLYLAKGKNQVFSKNQLWDALWGYEEYGDMNTVTVYISRLRDKIEKDSANPKYIKTVWGIGYKLDSSEKR